MLLRYSYVAQLEATAGAAVDITTRAAYNDSTISVFRNGLSLSSASNVALTAGAQSTIRILVVNRASLVQLEYDLLLTRPLASCSEVQLGEWYALQALQQVASVVALCRSTWTGCTPSCSGQQSSVSRSRSVVSGTCSAVLVQQSLASCGSKECNSAVGGALTIAMLLNVEQYHGVRLGCVPGSISLSGVSCSRIKEESLVNSLRAAIAASAGRFTTC